MAKQNKNIRLYNRTRKLVQAQLAEPGWTQARILANTTIKGATLSRICQGQRVSRKTTLQHILDELGALIDPGAPPLRKASKQDFKARRPKDTVSPSHFKVVPPGKVHREIFALLEVRWSELGGYATGWNDKRVAGCIGLLCSEQTVLQIREDAFGPAEGTAVAELEIKIAEVEALIVALTKDVTKLRGKR